MEIEEYLKQEKPSYQEGLKLLKKHKKNYAIITMLSFGISKTNWSILKTELEKIAESIRVVAIEEKKKDSLKINTDEDAFRLIKNINKNEFSRTYNIFLVHLKSKSIKTRFKAAGEILKSFDDVIVPTQNDIKHYNEYGFLPENHYLKREIPTNEITLSQRKLNLRSNISKNKKRPDRAAQVKLWEIELQQVIEKENALRDK